MRRERTISGTMVQYKDPVWDPLVDALGGHRAGWFMWMNEIELADDTIVHAYKHVSTRRYLHLSEDGRAYAYLGESRYREIELDIAIDLVHAGWEPEEDP